MVVKLEDNHFGLHLNGISNAQKEAYVVPSAVEGQNEITVANRAALDRHLRLRVLPSVHVLIPIMERMQCNLIR